MQMVVGFGSLWHADDKSKGVAMDDTASFGLVNSLPLTAIFWGIRIFVQDEQNKTITCPFYYNFSH